MSSAIFAQSTTKGRMLGGNLDLLLQSWTSTLALSVSSATRSSGVGVHCRREGPGWSWSVDVAWNLPKGRVPWDETWSWQKLMLRLENGMRG